MAKQNYRRSAGRTAFPHVTRAQETTAFANAKPLVDPKKRRNLEGNEINESAFSYYSSLQRVKEYVEMHYSEDIPLRTVARIAGIERKYFSTVFHRKIGITYSRWLVGVRIAKAMALIKAADNSLTGIASTVGFGDFRTFERSFKRITSLTPMEFKKSVRPS
jgi:transcriptional regulator GlxA family with amidase domain